AYNFFSYAVDEALHLSAEEEEDLIAILNKIDKECQHIDRHTQEIILSQIELLLNYSTRFYERQFITRKNNNHQLLVKFERIISGYFESSTAAQPQLLTVQRVAELMNLSPNYLSAAHAYRAKHTAAYSSAFDRKGEGKAIDHQFIGQRNCLYPRL